MLLGRIDEAFEAEYKEFLRLLNIDSFRSFTYGGAENQINIVNTLLILYKLKFDNAVKYVSQVLQNIFNHACWSRNIYRENIYREQFEKVFSIAQNTISLDNEINLYLPWNPDISFELNHVMGYWPNKIGFNEIEKKIDFLMSLDH